MGRMDPAQKAIPPKYQVAFQLQYIAQSTFSQPISSGSSSLPCTWISIGNCRTNFGGANMWIAGIGTVSTVMCSVRTVL